MAKTFFPHSFWGKKKSLYSVFSSCHNEDIDCSPKGKRQTELVFITKRIENNWNSPFWVWGRILDLDEERQMKRYMLLFMMIGENTSLEPQVNILVTGATIRDGRHYSGFTEFFLFPWLKAFAFPLFSYWWGPKIPAVSWVLRKMHPQCWAMYPGKKASPDNLIPGIPTAWPQAAPRQWVADEVNLSLFRTPQIISPSWVWDFRPAPQHTSRLPSEPFPESFLCYLYCLSPNCSLEE